MENFDDFYVDYKENSIDPKTPPEQSFANLDSQFFRFCRESASLWMNFERVDAFHQLGKPSSAGGRRLTPIEPTENLINIALGLGGQSDFVFQFIGPVSQFRISSPMPSRLSWQALFAPS